MADGNKGGFDEKAIEEDLKKLFDLLKSEKPQQQGSNQTEEIEKSTLMSLMLYLDLQKEEPEFFQSVKEKLIDTNESINLTAFIRTLLKPEISFDNLSGDKMASYFKIFDKEKKGSFSCDEFLELYRTSQEYLLMDQGKRLGVEQEIRDHFKVMEKDNKKEITPIEFYNIIHFKETN